MQRRFQRTVQRAQTRAAFAVALAALFLVAQASSFVHHATTVHAPCAAHGELTDVAGPASAASRDAAPSRPEATAWRSAPPAGSAEHDHCRFATADRERAFTLGDGAGSDAAPAASPADLASRAVDRPAAIPLYLLAPKHSPPA